MNGENVYPAEVENIIYGLDGIAQVAVVGVPRQPQGEVGMAFVVRNAGSVISEESVKRHCEQHLARYKCPFYVEFVDALPMNAAGKVLKLELRKQGAQLVAVR
jgi:acyl-CoA synthetase (AMP-forming)/AMP-acid ligase II